MVPSPLALQVSYYPGIHQVILLTLPSFLVIVCILVVLSLLSQCTKSCLLILASSLLGTSCILVLPILLELLNLSEFQHLLPLHYLLVLHSLILPSLLLLTLLVFPNLLILAVAQGPSLLDVPSLQALQKLLALYLFVHPTFQVLVSNLYLHPQCFLLSQHVNLLE